MCKTLVLLFHPNLARSTANAALAAAASSLPAVGLRDMQAAYPDGRISMEADGATEAARLLAAERIVLQYPVQWYATPPLMKAWLDAVLTRMVYIHAGTEGRALRGKPLMVAATVGNLPEAYTPGGANMFTMEALLAPLRATAHRCGLAWHEPFILYRANRLGAAELENAAAAYAARLRAFLHSEPAHVAVEG
ncbi:NAD(P)H-dependent oxidoreductase [Roseomonas eburnea]|uniref:NAD(P)H-dependent oxidoreductase n=1 Tax=Neoroseomonas eburnea TaxID=1346889 RepID=A0A9X9XDV0_9PROT|nr:NAD(P)H-dependent oxidoreductase [Neoroseomonas eburnea]MBR0681886.1 NAD(P)H-dependent oxidoreductase [Neoroseomonas eburnea]